MKPLRNSGGGYSVDWYSKTFSGGCYGKLDERKMV